MANTGMSICRNPSEKCSYFSSECSVCIARVGWFVGWEASGRTAAVLQGSASNICWKPHATSLCMAHQAFSQSVSLESKWCRHTIVLTRLEPGRIPILPYQRDMQLVMANDKHSIYFTQQIFIFQNNLFFSYLFFFFFFFFCQCT